MSMIDKWNPLRFSPTWDPFREIEEMRNQFSRLLGEQVPLRRNGGSEKLELTEWLPPVDITEDSKEYTIKAELPGLTKENVKVTVEDGVLGITGERKEEKEEKDKKHHRIERSYGSFRRSFTLPQDSSGEKITADFKDGVLKVHLPKDQTAKPKSVEVKVD
ncbi:MAG: Hsp20/alpha crystallin family protein [Verrucomicrobia bacterium]|nr:Hsp20/alpha crystallin family protein [Verrucomicrobiota bacterium]